MSSLTQQYTKILFKKDKYRTLIRYILNKDSKMSSLIQRYTKTLFRKNKY